MKTLAATMQAAMSIREVTITGVITAAGMKTATAAHMAAQIAEAVQRVTAAQITEAVQRAIAAQITEAARKATAVWIMEAVRKGIATVRIIVLRIVLIAVQTITAVETMALCATRIREGILE